MVLVCDRASIRQPAATSALAVCDRFVLSCLPFLTYWFSFAISMQLLIRVYQQFLYTLILLVSFSTLLYEYSQYELGYCTFSTNTEHILVHTYSYVRIHILVHSKRIPCLNILFVKVSYYTVYSTRLLVIQKLNYMQVQVRCRMRDSPRCVAVAVLSVLRLNAGATRTLCRALTHASTG